MGRTKVLYLSDEAFDLLKNSENASKLVSMLIKDYFNENSKNPIDSIKYLDEKKQTKIEVLSKEIELIDNQINNHNEDTKKIVDSIKIQEQKETKASEKIENIKKSFFESLGRNLEEGELEEYLKLLKESKTNFWKFTDIIRQKDYDKINKFEDEKSI